MDGVSHGGMGQMRMDGWMGIDCVSDLVRRSRLRWYGHVERKALETE